MLQSSWCIGMESVHGQQGRKRTGTRAALLFVLKRKWIYPRVESTITTALLTGQETFMIHRLGVLVSVALEKLRFLRFQLFDPRTAYEIIQALPQTSRAPIPGAPVSPSQPPFRFCFPINVRREYFSAPQPRSVCQKRARIQSLH